MRLRSIAVARNLTIAFAGLGLAQPASAAFLFFSSGANPLVLTVNGQNFTALDQGWITSRGEHQTNNNNYAVDDGTTFGYQFNNWGVFDLSNFSGSVLSASLRLNTEGTNVPTSVVYSLFDTSATLAQLDANRGINNAGGLALFADLGSGLSYGSRAYTQADAGQFRTITLNGTALSAIQQAAGRQFALGGTIKPSVQAVPEPATWALMIGGFGMIGGMMRSARQRGRNLVEA